MTVKQVKKKQKHKSKGSVRTITKQVKADSFFNFFDPPAVPDDPNAEVDEDTQVKYRFTNIENRTQSDANQQPFQNTKHTVAILILQKDHSSYSVRPSITKWSYQISLCQEKRQQIIVKPPMMVLERCEWERKSEKPSKVIQRLRNLPVSLISSSQALLTADFEIGHYIRERIVPRAVLFFTGEALEDESDCEEEESDEDEDDDNSDNDADFDPSKAQANPECKQQ